MRKIINDTELVPVTITDLTLENTVSEGKTNPPTTDAVARAIAGGSTTYTAGDGIAISEDEISAKVDGTTIGVNASGELEAIGGGGTTYTAGDGIAIDNDEISVDLQTNGGLKTETNTSIDYGAYTGVDPNEYVDTYQGLLYDPRFCQPLGGESYDFDVEGNDFEVSGVSWTGDVELIVYDKNDSSKYWIPGDQYAGNPLTFPATVGDTYKVELPLQVNFNTADPGTGTWNDWGSHLEDAAFALGVVGTTSALPWGLQCLEWSIGDIGPVVTSNPQLAVSVDDSTITINGSGQLQANCGIASTDVATIAVVNALPASPDSSTLYLIPEA